MKKLVFVMLAVLAMSFTSCDWFTEKKDTKQGQDSIENPVTPPTEVIEGDGAQDQKTADKIVAPAVTEEQEASVAADGKEAPDLIENVEKK